MATTPTVTDSAPASAPSSAPVSAPAPAAAPPPAAPPPAVSGPVTDSAPAPIEAPAAPTPGAAEPKASDYANDAEGQEKFLRDHNKWESEQPEAPPVEEPVPAEAPKTEEPGKEEPKAEEPKQPEKVADLTPEAVAEWEKTNPTFKAALAADPKLRGQIYRAMRINARAEKVLEIVPDVESARFANEQAGAFVGLRNGFAAAADDPEKFPAAMEQFANQFALRGPDGKVLTDAAGNVQYGRDFEMLAQGFVFGTFDDMISTFEERAKAAEDDSDDHVALSALKYARELIERETSGKGNSAPDTSKLTPEQKRWQEQQQREFDAERERLGLKTTQLSAEQRRAQQQTWDRGCRQKIGSSVGRQMDQFMKEKEAAGVYIPSYVLEARDPADGQTVFGKTVFDTFQKKVMSVPYLANQVYAWENAAPTPANEAARVEFYGRLIADFMPEIMDREFAKFSAKDKADREKHAGRADVRKQVAEVEPLGGSTGGAGAVLNDDEAMAKAYAMVDAKYPTINRVERTERALTEFNRTRR